MLQWMIIGLTIGTKNSLLLPGDLYARRYQELAPGWERGEPPEAPLWRMPGRTIVIPLSETQLKV